MTVRVCPKCRNMLTESSTVCINCGHRFAATPASDPASPDPPPPPPPPGVDPAWAQTSAPTEPPPGPQTAPCGHANPPGQAYCLTCGATIPAAGRASSTAAYETPGPTPYGAPGAVPYGTLGQPAYGAPPGYQPYYPGGPGMAPKTHARARNALILGIVGFVCCGLIFGSAAIYEGVKARKEIEASPFLEGDGLAIAGIVLGIISLTFNVLWIAYAVATANSGY